MQYFGGKSRYAKDIATVINQHINNMDYVEPFCGSCNVLSQVKTSGTKYAYDKHPYLIAMWKEVMNDWIPPTNVSEEEYYAIKNLPDEKPYLTGFVGFACSFAGKWWGGYARSKRPQNFAKQSCNTVLEKKNNIGNTLFGCCDFLELNPQNSFVYCDPPYKNTTQYCKSLLGNFPYEEFIKWVKEKSENNIVIVSEYKQNMPDGAKIIWEKQTATNIRDKGNSIIDTTEVLFTFNNI